MRAWTLVGLIALGLALLAGGVLESVLDRAERVDVPTSDP